MCCGLSTSRQARRKPREPNTPPACVKQANCPGLRVRAFFFCAGRFMGASSMTPDERARKASSIVLQRLSPTGTQSALATALGVSEATISRNKEHIEAVLTMVAHLGLKVVDESRICLNPGEIKFLRETYARVQEQAPWLLNESES